MGKNRTIVAIVLGYIIGILWGLYLDISIVPMYLIGFLIFKIISFTRIFKFIKVFITPVTIVLIIISSLLSNSILIKENDKYNNLYSNLEKIEIKGKIVDNGINNNYTNRYKVKVENVNSSKAYKNTYIYLYYNDILQYGDLIYIEGEFEEAETARNFKGFDYKEYLKTLKIYGSVKAKKLKIIDRNTNNKVLTFFNNIFLKIKEYIETNFDNNTSGVLLGILLGHTENINEEIRKQFSDSNISHILAVSGMHISYLVIGITFILDKIVGKRKSNAVTIMVLVAYMLIAGFRSSVVRASLMAIMVLISKLIYRKNDIWTSISLSLLILLIYNPFLITSLSIQFTYMATIGIILLQKNILHFFKNIRIKDPKHILKKKKITNEKMIKILNPIYEILSVSISAQITIFPITIMSFNTFGLTFFITNFLISFIIPPIIILGLILIILVFIGIKFNIVNFILKVLINILIQISKMGNLLPLSKILVVTPDTWQIVIYYILIIVINYLYAIWKKRKITAFERRIKNIVYLIKYKIRKNKYIILILLLSTIVICNLISINNRKLEIHFIDVGQGDSTLLITPNKKTILVDGGGSEFYDVGENTLLPYLLDRKVIKIDYMIISHFDTDHLGRNFIFATRDKS